MNRIASTSGHKLTLTSPSRKPLTTARFGLSLTTATLDLNTSLAGASQLTLDTVYTVGEHIKTILNSQCLVPPDNVIRSQFPKFVMGYLLLMEKAHNKLSKNELWGMDFSWDRGSKLCPSSRTFKTETLMFSIPTLFRLFREANMDVPEIANSPPPWGKSYPTIMVYHQKPRHISGTYEVHIPDSVTTEYDRVKFKKELTSQEQAVIKALKISANNLEQRLQQSKMTPANQELMWRWVQPYLAPMGIEFRLPQPSATEFFSHTVNRLFRAGKRVLSFERT